MPGAVELFHGLCATTLLAYLAGWPATLVGSERRRRLRFFGVGLLLAAVGLLGTGWNPLVAVGLALVGSALALGLSEAIAWRPTPIALPAALGPLEEEPEVDDGFINFGPPPPDAPITDRPPPPDPEPQPEPQPPAEPAAEAEPARGMLGPLAVQPIEETMHGHAMLGPLDPNERAKASVGRKPVAVSCPRCGKPNPHDATTCVHCQTAM